MKMAEALRLISAGKHTEAQRMWRDVLDFIRRNEMAFQQNLDVYRVIEVAKIMQDSSCKRIKVLL